MDQAREKRTRIVLSSNIIPNRDEVEVLEGYTYGMSPEQIATSTGLPIVKVSRCTGNLYKKWHKLEDKARTRSSSRVTAISYRQSERSVR